MYHPIIKNKVNELKGVKQVDINLNYTPIIELTDTKTEDKEKLFGLLFDSSKANSIINILKYKNCYIDIPSYLNNQIINNFNLDDGYEKYNMFKELNDLANSNGCKDFIPIISFGYNHPTERKSNKENIKFAKKIIENFDNFAIRIYSNYSFRSDDYNLLWQLYDFFGDEITRRATLIFDIDNFTMEYTYKLIKEIQDEFYIKHIVLAGEVLKGNDREYLNEPYDRLSNKHLERYKYFLNTFNGETLDIDYADFTLTDKIPSKLEIDPEKGFSYYPFIKFTTEDAKLCMFTANEKGDYSQYKDLCEEVVKGIRGFSSEHCKTCKFIQDVANGEKLKFKAGSTWKYRMIGHHITALSMCNEV